MARPRPTPVGAKAAAAIANAELQKSGSVLVHGHERDVRDAAAAQLQALHKG
jgi:hypothetical protein